jgi:hypothetical protein
MGLRDKLRSVKKFLKDPQAWTEGHGSTMNAEYAKYGTPEDGSEVHEPPPKDTPAPEKSSP